MIVRYYLLLLNYFSLKARRLQSAYKFVYSEGSSCLRNTITCFCCLAVLHDCTKLLVPRFNNSLATTPSDRKLSTNMYCSTVYFLHVKALPQETLHYVRSSVPVHNFVISS